MGVETHSVPPMPEGPKDLERKASVDALIIRLEKKAVLPVDLLKKQVQMYQAVNEDEWNGHFPVGYRETVAAEFLSEIYSSNSRGEDWGRDFLMKRQLMQCFPARELMASLSALDSIILSDREKGALNKVAVEKLARKAFGLVKAYEPVRVEADWKRPRGDAKNWRNKVDWMVARKVDP